MEVQQPYPSHIGLRAEQCGTSITLPWRRLHSIMCQGDRHCCGAGAEHEAAYEESMNGSEAEDNGEDIEHSASKGAGEDSPNGVSGAPEETVRRKAPVVRKITGPRLPQLQPAIHSASTAGGVYKPHPRCIKCLKRPSSAVHWSRNWYRATRILRAAWLRHCGVYLIAHLNAHGCRFPSCIWCK